MHIKKILHGLTLTAVGLAAPITVLAGHGPATGTKKSGPAIVHTGTAPTGYEVTFKFDAPDATRVQIFGQWAFSDPAFVTGLFVSEQKMPSAWEPGDIPAAPFWTLDMSKDADGLWTFTTPLPSGTYNYAFYVNCPTNDGAGCTRIVDPTNPAYPPNPGWNAAGSAAIASQVYVPSDRKFGTTDRSDEEPVDNLGTLLDLAYPSTVASGTHRLAVYLPDGYDPTRAVPYPTLYLSHGAGGHEVSWTTEGVAHKIAQKAFNDRVAQPTVIVMTNFNSVPNGTTGYATEVLTKVIPFIESNFNVSHEAAGRAFGGLSAGGARAMDLLYNHTDAFDYYGLWSVASRSTTLTNEQAARLRQVPGAIHVGVGFQDFAAPGIGQFSLEREATFASLGIHFDSHNIPGIHTWDVWRQLLSDFVRNVAFKTTNVTATIEFSDERQDHSERADQGRGHGWRAVAQVTPHTQNVVAPTGFVWFYLDGDASTGTFLGKARVRKAGTAVLPIHVQGMHSITAVYAGDAYFDGSDTDETPFEITPPRGVGPAH